MTEKPRSIKRFGGIMAVLGLTLSLAGLSILSKTGSYYFTVVGGFICLSGILIAFRQIAGVYLYLATTVLIVSWSLLELNFQYNALLPRITVPLALLFYVLTPGFRAQFNQPSPHQSEGNKFNNFKPLSIVTLFLLLLAAYYLYIAGSKRSGSDLSLTASIDQQMVGVWRDVDMLIFLAIKDNGAAFQCRIAADESVIAAAGKVVQHNTINWGRVSSWDTNGQLNDFYQLNQGFKTWGEDVLSIQEKQLMVGNHQGHFPHIPVAKMPPSCEYHPVSYGQNP